MGWLIGSLLWALLVAGGLPTEMQRHLEERTPFWEPRLMGIVSSLLEIFCGFGLLQLTLVLAGLEVASRTTTLVAGLTGFYLLAEGILRLALTLKLPDSAVPSLPVVLVARALARLSP